MNIIASHFLPKRYWGSVHYKFSESWIVSKWKWGHDQSKVWLKRKFYCRYESKCSQSLLGESREGEKRINVAKQTEPDPERKEMESSRKGEKREDQERSQRWKTHSWNGKVTLTKRNHADISDLGNVKAEIERKWAFMSWFTCGCYKKNLQKFHILKRINKHPYPMSHLASPCAVIF